MFIGHSEIGSYAPLLLHLGTADAIDDAGSRSPRGGLTAAHGANPPAAQPQVR